MYSTTRHCLYILNYNTFHRIKTRRHNLDSHWQPQGHFLRLTNEVVSQSKIYIYINLVAKITRFPRFHPKNVDTMSIYFFSFSNLVTIPKREFEKWPASSISMYEIYSGNSYGPSSSVIVHYSLSTAKDYLKITRKTIV